MKTPQNLAIGTKLYLIKKVCDTKGRKVLICDMQMKQLRKDRSHEFLSSISLSYVSMH